MAMYNGKLGNFNLVYDDQEALNASAGVEKSLLEFISDYFEGDVSDDFSTTENSVHMETSAVSLFDSSVSDQNSSIELDTSESSMNTLIHVENKSESDLMDQLDDNAIKLGPIESRRKSISYEIRFTSSKDNGKLKLHIVPSKSRTPGSESEHVTTHEENACLRQRIFDLEEKIQCIETQSESIVGELTRILERKNETISRLELQLAGIKFMNSSI